MSIPLIINGVTYDYPETNDQKWGPDATQWASGVTTGMLQKAGGLFQLLAEVDLGTSFGIKSIYYSSRTSNAATAGQVRLARADVISWRNQANSGNLDLSVDSSNKLLFDGAPISDAIEGLTGDGTATGPGTVPFTLATVNVTTGSFGSSTSTPNFVVNGKGLITAAASTSIQIAESQVTNLVSDLAAKQTTTLTNGNILIGNGSNVATSVPVTGDVTITNAGVSAIGSNKVTNAQLAQMAAHTFKGNNTGSTANALDLTATQLTAELNVMTGGGSTGLKGLVPSQVGGDTTKFLRGDATWATPAGAGDVVGPGSSTDNAVARFDLTTGKIIQNSAVIIDDSANITGVAGLSMTGTLNILANNELRLQDTTGGEYVGLKSSGTQATYTITMPAAAPATKTGLFYDGTNYVWQSLLTNYTAYTPTITGCGTVTNNTAWWRRVGDSVEVYGRYTAGTVTAAILTVSLPSSLTYDTTKVTPTQTMPLGVFYRATGTNNDIPGTAAGAFTMSADSTSTGTVFVANQTNTAAGMFITALGSSVLGTGNNASYRFTVPVTAYAF